MPLVPRGLERRSVAPGDMKSLIVEEMSILWSAIGSLELVQGGKEVCLFLCALLKCGCWGWDGVGEHRALVDSASTSLTQ